MTFGRMQTFGGYHGRAVLAANTGRYIYADCPTCGDGFDPTPVRGDLTVVCTGERGTPERAFFINCPMCGGPAKLRFIARRKPRVAGGSRCNAACLNGKRSCDCRCGGRCHGATVCQCDKAAHAA